MNCDCMMIFRNRKDRKSIEAYRRLANIIERAGDDLYAENIAKCKKRLLYVRDYDEAMAVAHNEFGIMTCSPKQLQKDDMFLWVCGKYYLMRDRSIWKHGCQDEEDKRLLREVVAGWAPALYRKNDLTEDIENC